MKLTVLMDNTTIIDQPYIGESGLSFLIETEDETVIFDTGWTPLFLSNARKMRIDLTKASAVVISHGHNDHTGGLAALGRLMNRAGKKVPLVLHPLSLEKKCWENPKGITEEIGIPSDLDTLEAYFQLLPSVKPVRIGRSLLFLGEIPRPEGEQHEAIGYVVNAENQRIPDHLKDDSALVYEGRDGLVVITGCSHSGVPNLLRYVNDLYPGEKIRALIGGFHMLSREETWLAVEAAKIKEFEPETIYPCHCTDEASRCFLRREFRTGALGVGSMLTFD